MVLMNPQPFSAAASINDILHLSVPYTDAERSRLVEQRDHVADLSTHLTPGECTPLGKATMLLAAATAIREGSDILAAARIRPHAHRVPGRQ